MSHESAAGELTLSTRTDRFKAVRDGKKAYSQAKALTACPYKGSDAKNSHLRRYWVKGYMNARQERARANRAAAEKVAAPAG